MSRIFSAGHHHAQIVDLEVVALQYDADDVLADVVNVALDGGHNDLAVAARAFAGLFFRFDERHQMRHRLLHHAGALHHLRQEHLAGAEQIADGIHAVHQRPLDHFDGPRRGEARLFRVCDDVAIDALHQSVAQAFVDVGVAPSQVGLASGHARLAAVALRYVEQPLAGVRAAVQHGVLHGFLQVGRKRIDDGQLAGVDDAHGQPGIDGVVEKHRVDGFAHSVVPRNENETLLMPPEV